MRVYWGYNRCPPKDLLRDPGGYCCMRWNEVSVSWESVPEESKFDEGYRAPTSEEIRAEIIAINGDPSKFRYLRHGERILTHCRRKA